MLIVGERINSTRRRINRAVRNRDAALIAREAKRQVEAGADYIDVNAGTSVAREAEDLVWLVETVQSAVEAPLCIDSANPDALRGALSLATGTPIINSITAEAARKDRILPLVLESNAAVVALLMDDSGMPEDAAGRIKVAEKLIPELEDAGVGRERIHIDPLVRPVSTDTKQGFEVLETVHTVMTRWPGVHTICGLSNVSFGLPARNVLNATFLALMMQAGLDGAIIDPTEPRMTATIAAAEAILGRDDFCMKYIEAHRSGRFNI
ncbi:MAG: dihydropteroate synthase [Planctomycetota bacterium]|jgi:5-methyltetrahydrofolate--homocysteine methyltransferase